MGEEAPRQEPEGMAGTAPMRGAPAHEGWAHNIPIHSHSLTHSLTRSLIQLIQLTQLTHTHRGNQLRMKQESQKNGCLPARNAVTQGTHPCTHSAVSKPI